MEWLFFLEESFRHKGTKSSLEITRCFLPYHTVHVNEASFEVIVNQTRTETLILSPTLD